MNNFINAIEKSLEEENWYAALALALALPDICANVFAPEAGSMSRYVDWYNTYLLNKYTSYIGPDKQQHIFLSGEDCYALRCSLLHEGSSDISRQRAKKALENFNFRIPREGIFIHKNKLDQTLQLQVDVFCQDICEAAKAWMEDANMDGNMSSLLTIN